MPAMPSPLVFSQLLDCASKAVADAPYSAISDTPFVLLDASDKQAAPDDVQRVVDWLTPLTCPVLGIAHDAIDNRLIRACDVRLASVDDATLLIKNIRRNPIAASVLVQVLRTTESMKIEDALTVESLAYATLQSGAQYQSWLALNRTSTTVVMRDDGPPVIIERDGDELRIAINRPANRNAISVEVRDALNEAFALIEADESIVHAVVSGRGKCFSTGGDLSEFGSVPDPAAGHAIRGLCLPARQLLRCGEGRIRFALHGACIGAGIELSAFARDITAAADGTFFQLPELRFGLIPGAGGCVSIPRRIGRQRTAWLALSGRRINAATALKWGLVDALT